MSKQFSRRSALRLGALAASAPAVASLVPATAAQGAGSTAGPATAGTVPRPGWAGPNWSVRPFALNQVALREGIFQQKRDRMLNYARIISSPLGSPPSETGGSRWVAGRDLAVRRLSGAPAGLVDQPALAPGPVPGGEGVDTVGGQPPRCGNWRR